MINKRINWKNSKILKLLISGEYKTSNIELNECWKLGIDDALKFLDSYGYSSQVISEDLRTSPNITIMHPRGSALTVEESTEELDEEQEGEIPDGEVPVVEDVVDLSQPTISEFVSDVLFDVNPYIDWEGNKYHKSNLVNSMLNSTTKLLSSDRCVRVQIRQAASIEEEEGPRWL